MKKPGNPFPGQHHRGNAAGTCMEPGAGPMTVTPCMTGPAQSSATRRAADLPAAASSRLRHPLREAPPTDWADRVQVHDDRNVFRAPAQQSVEHRGVLRLRDAACRLPGVRSDLRAGQLQRDGYGLRADPHEGGRGMLKRPENLTEHRKVRLEEILQHNLESVRAHLLREGFQGFWSASAAGRRRAWKSPCSMCSGGSRSLRSPAD